MRKISTVILLFAIILSSLPAFSGAAGAAELDGYLKQVSGGTVQITDAGSNTHSFFLLPGAVLLIDERPVSIGEFKPGMPVSVQFSGKAISKMEGYSTLRPGYLPPGGEALQGTILSLPEGQIRVRLDSGQEKTYFPTSATIVTRQGKQVPLSDLYAGDRILLFFSDIDSQFPDRIEAEGPSILIRNLYRGQLEKADEISGKIYLKNVQVFQNGTYQDYKPVVNFSYYDFQNVPVYAGNRLVPLSLLKYYRGKQVYLAMKDLLGKEQIARMVIQAENATSYSDKISKVNWYSRSFELENRQNLTFGDGTIIIKSRRLVSPYIIAPGLSAYILADGREGSRTTSIVYIYNEELNNSSFGQYNIYFGRIGTVTQGKAVLERFSVLSENEWESYRTSEDLYYDDDTFFLNAETGETLSAEAFFTGAYKGSEDGYYYLYAFTDGDRIAGAVLSPSKDSLDEQRATIGVVDGVSQSPALGWVAALRDVRDWSSQAEMWIPRGTLLRVNLDKALILRQNRAITPEDLRPGDTLYLVRDDFAGKVIVVK